MNTTETNLLNSIISSTQSELILFAIVIVIAMAIIMVPLYRMMIAERKQKTEQENIRQDKYIQREQQIIQVVTANTEVMAGLKATLESNGMTTSESFRRIQQRLDDCNGRLTGFAASMSQMQATLERAIANQSVMLDGISRTVIATDNVHSHSKQSP